MSSASFPRKIAVFFLSGLLFLGIQNIFAEDLPPEAGAPTAESAPQTEPQPAVEPVPPASDPAAEAAAPLPGTQSPVVEPAGAPAAEPAIISVATEPVKAPEVAAPPVVAPVPAPAAVAPAAPAVDPDTGEDVVPVAPPMISSETIANLMRSKVNLSTDVAILEKVSVDDAGTRLLVLIQTSRPVESFVFERRDPPSLFIQFLSTGVLASGDPIQVVGNDPLAEIRYGYSKFQDATSDARGEGGNHTLPHAG
jgi:hypothetical protein